MIYWVARGVRIRVKGRIPTFVGGLMEPRSATGAEGGPQSEFLRSGQSIHGFIEERNGRLEVHKFDCP